MVKSYALNFIQTVPESTKPNVNTKNTALIKIKKTSKIIYNKAPKTKQVIDINNEWIEVNRKKER